MYANSSLQVLVFAKHEAAMRTYPLKLSCQQACAAAWSKICTDAEHHQVESVIPTSIQDVILKRLTVGVQQKLLPAGMAEGPVA